ncbi:MULTISPECIES: helix-turn-helix domain-containing protein [Vibrio]|uniref:helix-turn-helix domain-containing protein n=1 Tax=Vibrio TaxID=662 RepID=UPI0001B99AEB|nr:MULTISPECIES: helix-turn-helix domain-containing protein [Vibrio]EEX67315.1 transcriptional regulator XRE family [Vibrio metoecus]PAR93157.1 transcriptional regulator [Vibrio cholerae]
MGLGKKIKAVRIAEGLSQVQMSELIDISIGSLRDWEQERRIPGGDALTDVTNHERFQKYTFWLMTGKTLPESGQVCPDFSILLELGIVEDDASTQKRA